ncbi:MAG: SDR family NAD(P)-dependent oxidoreductase [Bryobacteraceae bacterium]|nr:SDR family NAD(P)-dependent oxidoreductase [Bryobacteraceae bacterium]
MDLRERVAIITGASEGIGAATARAFRREGARLVLNALAAPPDDLAEGDAVAHCIGDVTEEAARRRIVELAAGRFGRVDILINNAAVGLYAPPSSVPADLARRLFDINVIAPLALTQLVIPVMRRQRSGAIVNLGSVGGGVSLPWAVVYCASKFAMHAVSDSQRRELARDGIHVMKVCPGIVDTRFRENVLAGQAPSRVESIRRIVTSEQVADGIVRGLRARRRNVYVPPIGKLFMTMEFLSPRLMDWYVARKW